jgi:hypothetical protein
LRRPAEPMSGAVESIQFGQGGLGECVFFLHPSILE